MERPRLEAPRLGGIPFFMCMRFVARPGTGFWNTDIVDTFGVSPSSVYNILKAPIKAGWIKAERIPGERSPWYCAGTTLDRVMEGMRR